jgi:hypothetical protein
MSLKQSRRLAAKQLANQSEAALLAHIATLQTSGNIKILKTQMASEGIPVKKSVKKALAEREEQIKEEQEQDVYSPGQLSAKRKRIMRAQNMRLRTAVNRGTFFGPGTRKKSRARRAMEVTNERNLNAALEASHQQQNAVAEAAAEAVQAQEAAVQEPYFRVPGHSRGAYHELLGYPALLRAEREQGTTLLPSLHSNGGPRRFTPEELVDIELRGYPKWLAEQRKKGGRSKTYRKQRGRRRR